MKNRAIKEPTESAFEGTKISGVDLPPPRTLRQLPEGFDTRHAVAFLYLNLFQLINRAGMDDWESLPLILKRWEGLQDRELILGICSKLARWTQRELRPKDIRPHAWTLIELARKELSPEDLGALVRDLHAIADHGPDPSGDAKRFAGFIECAFFGENQKHRKVFIESVENDWRDLLKATVTVLTENGSLSYRQKLALKETVANWSEFVNISGELELIDYALIDGRDVFGQIDYPLHFYEKSR